MKLSKYLLFIFAFVSIIACKKDDETKTTPSLQGSLQLTATEYLEPNSSYDFCPTGAIHPEDGEVKYYVKVTIKDTTYTLTNVDNVFSYTFPDTLGSYVITATAEAENYTSLTAVKYVTVVRGGVNLPGEENLERSITGRSNDKTKLSEEDLVEIDGEMYYSVQIGDQTWLRENLSSKTKGTNYMGYNVMSNVFGTYYSWEEALEACPEGWRLPTNSDWLTLAQTLGANETNALGNFSKISSSLIAEDAAYLGEEMWEWWPRSGTKYMDFDALACGYANLEAKTWSGMYEYATFWTADEKDSKNAYYRYLFVDSPDLKIGIADKKTFGASVRCVK